MPKLWTSSEVVEEHSIDDCSMQGLRPEGAGRPVLEFMEKQMLA